MRFSSKTVKTLLSYGLLLFLILGLLQVFYLLFPAPANAANDDPGSIAFTRTASPNDQYLSTTVSAPGNDSLTYEWWFKYSDNSLKDMGMLVTRSNGGSDCNGIDVTIDYGKLKWGKCTVIDAAITLPKDQWNHIAFVRTESTSWVVYLNGESKLTYSTTAAETPTTSTYLRIGRKYGSTETFSGNITNFRYVKGVAVYTGNFTVPTQQLTATQVSGSNISAISGNQTQLLLNMNQGARAKVDAISNRTLNSNGTISSSIDSPFSAINYVAPIRGSISTYSGNNISPIYGEFTNVPGNTQSYTVEFWFYTTSVSTGTYQWLFAQNQDGKSGGLELWINNGGQIGGGTYGVNYNDKFLTNVVTINTWHHLAIGANTGGTTSIFLDGSKITIDNFLPVRWTEKTWNLGGRQLESGFRTNPFVPTGLIYPLSGYVADFRYVLGTQIYTSNFTRPSAPLTAVSGTQLLLSTFYSTSSDIPTMLSDSSGNSPTLSSVYARDTVVSSTMVPPFTNSTITTHTISNSTPTFGSSVTLTASVTLGATGAVAFKDSGNDILCTTGNLAAGSASCSWQPTSATTYNVRAVYSGDAAYDSSYSVATEVVVSKAPQTITATSSSLNLQYGSTATLGSSGSSGTGSKTYSVDSGSCSITSTTLTSNGIGNCVVKVVIATDTNYLAATSDSITISMTERPITITAANKTAIFTGSSVSVSNSFTISSGTLVVSNDITGATYTYTSVGGYNSTTAPTAAGVYSITPSAAVFATEIATNYSVSYTAGTLTISSVPVISSTSASSITSTSAALNFTSSTTGNYYLLVYASADTSPTAIEVMAQGTAIKKATSSVLASANSVSITGLTLSTTYKAYVVVKDGLNLNSTVSTIEFTTLMAAPNAPGFRSARVKLIADNDYAVYMGSDLSITRVLHQSNVDWPAQVASIGTLDVFPLAGETYMYVLAMGGNGSFSSTPMNCVVVNWQCGQEDWSGTINGRSVFNYSGAQVAINRSVSDPTKTDYVHWGYLLLNNYLPNFGISQGAVEGGTYSVSFDKANEAIANVVWGPATLADHADEHKIRTNCTVSCRVIDDGVDINAWAFPNASAVIFRYPLSNAQLPVTAGDKQVVVDWDAPVGGGVVAKYLVDYKESSEPDGAYKSFSEIAAGTTIETVTGLTNGTSYTFRVTAVNAGGTASSVSRAVTPTGAPSQPLNLSYAAGAGYVDVSFTAPENNGGFNITNYSYSIDNGANWVTRSPQSTTSPVRISGLTDGTTYQVKLKAINPSGAGLASTVIAAKPGITVNRTVSYVSGTLATIAGLPTGGTYVAGDTFRIASGPTRTNFTFTGWKDGATSYQPGDTFTVGASNSTLTAQWIQDSLLGTAAGDRSRVLTWNIVSGTGVDATVSGGADNSVRVQIPADALAPGTEVIFWRLLNDNVAKSKINNSNSYIVNLAVSWSIGDDVTVAKTVQTATSPVTLTVTNGSIKAGATAWQIIGDNVRVIGTASQDGVLNLSFTEDPVIAAANVANPPVFGATTSTADGFTVSITNYDAAYVWENPTVSAGNVAITSTAGSTRLLTVTGLTIGQSATISQSNSLSGVANSSRTTTVTGSATAGAALNPVFGTATATADGFTISITNYDSSYTWATPTVSSGTVTVTSTSGTNRLLTVTGLSSGGSATITQTTSRAGYSGGSRTATGTAITATPVVVQQPVAPAPVEPAPVIQGPPPSTLKITFRPKISRDSENLYCQAGKFLFLREGRIEESAKLSTQVFSLIQNGKVVDSSKSANEKVAFVIKTSYMDTTLSCLIEAEQENLAVSGQSLDFETMSKLSKDKNLAISSADGKYYSDREAAYAKKAQSFAELGKIKDAALAAAKSSKEIMTARMTYQKAYTAASSLWKKELADAATNRVLVKELAQQQYLVALEAAGISIYPKAEKAVVTPTPTPTPTVKPTPTPSPTATNVQPTAEMKKVGTVYMATGSYVLNASTKITLKALALQINAQQIKQVLVYGHTDSRGGVNNTVLSQNRAKAVANYLRPLLKGKKIVIGWYASRKPAATGTTAADLAKNRRVEVYTK
jgi:uncharacterized repeat protein (TIGR02543 family)